MITILFQGDKDGAFFLSLTGFKLNKLIVNDAFLGLAHYKAGGEVFRDS